MMTGLYPAGHEIHENARVLSERHEVLADRVIRDKLQADTTDLSRRLRRITKSTKATKDTTQFDLNHQHFVLVVSVVFFVMRRRRRVDAASFTFA